MSSHIIESLSPNDCAIVACSHYFGISYDNVALEFQELVDRANITWQRTMGTPIFITRSFFYKRGLKMVKVPRHGQEKISGVVSMHRNGALKGHLVAMIDGIVFDAFEPEGLPIKQYQLRYKHSHIREIWR